MRTVILMGIGGAYNYGCEAIVRGTEAILHARWPEVRLVYASLRPEDDRARLSGCNVEIVPRKLRGRYSPTNVTRKLLSLLGVRWYPITDSFDLVEGNSAVLSVGGDVYTLYPGGQYNLSLPKFGSAIERRGTPYVLWGASVGPFTRIPKVERFFRRHLSSIRLITARERDTIAYLASIGVTSNVVSCADPAYLVAPQIVREPPRSDCKPTIGINLSPLSALYTDLSREQVIAAQARGIEQLISTHDARIVLVPHSVCNFLLEDDDSRYLSQIRDAIAPQYRDKVELLDTDPGFIGVKKALIQCDLVIAARMHCAINAMVAHVPTLLVAYSQKARGMCEYVYGHREWLCSVDDFGSPECLSTVGKMLEQRAAIQSALESRIPEVQADARRPLDALEPILMS